MTTVYPYQRVINSDRLNKEIRAQSFGSALNRIDTEDLQVFIYFERELTEAEKATLDTLLVNHIPVAQEEIIAHRIQSAIEFGQSLVVEFGTMNVQSNKSSVEILQMMSLLQNVMLLLMVGSLYTAIDAIDALPVTELTPIQLKNYFKWKIQDFLGVSRT